MIDFEIELLSDHDDWRRVLETYRKLAVADASTRPQVDAQVDAEPSWIPRVAKIDGIDGRRLTKIHGQLIALGFLKFELEGRTSGVSYRVTREGNKALDRLAHREPDTAAA